LEEARRGSTSPAVGQGRIKGKHNYPGPQVEAEDNVHHGLRQRGIGYEETEGRNHHYENIEKGAPGSNGSASRASSRIHCKSRGIQYIYGTDPGRVHRVSHSCDCNPDNRHTRGEDRVGSKTSSGDQGEVQGNHKGDR
jgi:hypothetical protein